MKRATGPGIERGREPRESEPREARFAFRPRPGPATAPAVRDPGRKTRRLFALVLGAGLVLTGCGGGAGGAGAGSIFQPSGSALSAAALFELGEAAQLQGNLYGALALYQRVLTDFPASGLADDAWLGIGNVHLANSDFEAAREAYRTAASTPGADRAADARLAAGRAHVAEFEHLDGGTPGFVDTADPGEFLPNLEAIEAFRDLAGEAGASPQVRLQARFELALALFRVRRFAEARAEFGAYATAAGEPVAVARAHVQSGLAFIEEGNGAGALAEFAAAGAAGPAKGAEGSAEPSGERYSERTEFSTSSGQTRGGDKLGPFAAPVSGFIDLSELVILVQRTVTEADTVEGQRVRAELGLAVTRAWVLNDLARATSGLEALAAREFPAPVGDLVRFQLAEARLKAGNRDGAVRDCEALLTDYPASAFSQRARERLGELLFDSFSREAAAGQVVDGRLLANLEANLRAAVGSGREPLRQARTSALNMLGRLDAEGIPVHLTIAEPRGLPEGYSGVAYRHELSAFGAQGALTWSLSPDSRLPEGLSLSAQGVLSGTPRSPARGYVTLRATDASGSTDSRPFLLTVDPFRVVTPPRLFDAFEGESFSAGLQAEGTGPFTFSAVQLRRVGNDGRPVEVAGFVPGLVLSASGAISGTPTEPSGSQPFLMAVRILDGQGRKQVSFFSLYVLSRGPAAKPEADSAEVPVGLVAGSRVGLPPGQGSGDGVPGTTLRPTSSHPLSPVTLGSAPLGTLTTTPVHSQELAVTPDGSKLVVVSGFLADSIAVVDLATGASRRASLPGPYPFGTFSFAVAVSPDSRRAAVGVFSNSHGKMHLVELDTLTTIRTVETGPRTQAIDFTPDGRLAVARSAVQVTSLEVETGTTAAIPIPALGSGRSLAMFPDSRHVLVAGEETSNLAVVLDLESRRSVTFALPAPVVFGDVLPDGREAIFIETGLSGTRAFLLDAVSGATESLFVGANPGNLAVSADGRRAAVTAVGSGELALIEIPARRVRRLRMDAPGFSSAVAISPDGSTVAAFDHDGAGRAFLVDFASLNVRQVEGITSSGQRNRRLAAFTPDGAFLFGMTGIVPFSRVLRLDTRTMDTALGIERAALPPAETGKTYSHRLRGQGGRPAYRFWPGALVAGVPGIALDEDGRLSGAPHVSGLYALEACLEDSAGTTASFTVPLLVRDPDAPEEPLTLFTRGLVVAQPGRAYRNELAAIGGVRPYRFSLAGGALPEGLELSDDGVLSGQPVRSTTATIVVRVTDARGAAAEGQLALEVTRPVPFELPPVSLELPAPALDVLAVDLNRDGRDDLAVGHESPTTNLSILLAGEGGAFEPAAVIAVRDVGQPGTGPAGAVRRLLRGDFDGNGRPDLAVQVFPGLGARVPSFTRPAVVPLMGDGAGGFTLAAALDVPIVLVDPAVGDLDGDALDDVLAVCYANIPGLGILPGIHVQLSAGNGTFSTRGPFLTTSPLNTLQNPEVAELTGDAIPDLAARSYTTPDAPQSVRVFRGTGNGGFDVAHPSVVFSAPTTVAQITAVKACDLDGDGRVDLLAIEDRSLVVVRQTGPGLFSEAVRIEVGPGPGRPVAADVDGDTLPDVLIPLAGLAELDNAGAGVAFLANLGGGRFDAPVVIAVEGAPAALTVGDFDGDRVPDVAVTCGAAPRLTLLHGKAR